MNKLTLIYPGKTKSLFIKNCFDEYLKILRPFTKIELCELKEGKGEKAVVIKEESEKFKEKLNPNFVLLDAKGENPSSEEFAAFIKTNQEIHFAIGGVFGVSEELKTKAPKKISLSKMTFTHEITRLLLIEQIYRAFTIINNRKYHY